MKISPEHIYLCLSSIPHIGPVTFKKLIEHFGSANKIYSASKHQLSEVLDKKTATIFDHSRSTFKSDSILSSLFNLNVRYLTFESPLYPISLRTIPDPPIGIYVKGDPILLTNSLPKIAIVGTRRPTSYGKQCTECIISELKHSNSTIISGLALGIDGLAHLRALEYKLPTIAVLGTGIDEAYPKEHSQLYQEIAESGLIISEHPPGALIHKGSFPTRNRIVTALADKVIVIEGAKTSGTLITARYAAEQGKEVFALPGNITSCLSEAPNTLIQQGASPLVSLNNVCDQLGIKMISTKKAYNNLPGDLTLLLKKLSDGPSSPEQLIEITRKPIHEILTLLSTLEVNGLVKKNDLGEYYLT